MVARDGYIKNSLMKKIKLTIEQTKFLDKLWDWSETNRSLKRQPDQKEILLRITRIMDESEYDLNDQAWLNMLREEYIDLSHTH